MKKVQIKSIKFNNRKEKVYDIETPTHDYVLANGVISHNTQEMFSKPVVSGGTGIYYSASAIFIIGRQQEKDADGIAGYNFIINVEKSRYVREKSKIPVQVLHESGLNRYSGLLDIAMELGVVIKPSNGWYSRVDEDGVVEDKKTRAKDTQTEAFWGELLASDFFRKKVESRYKLSSTSMTDNDIDLAMGELEDE